MKRYLPALLLLAGLSACGDSTGGGGGGPTVASLTLGPTTIFTQVGDSTHLSVTARDGAGATVVATITYRSLNTGVASVDAAGVVRGVGVGATTVIASAGNAADSTAVTVLAAGSLLTLNANANNGCTVPITIKARVAATSTRAILAEDLGNPAGGFTQAEYDAIGARFDNLIYPIDIANFGAPTDIDGNARVIILYTKEVNKLTPVGANFLIGGFFYGRDLFPQVATPRLGACPTSNQAEMFYMLAPDPAGTINGHVRTKDYVASNTVGTIAHEFEHLINQSRRLYINLNADYPEEGWLDEGLAHIAEELAFFSSGGLNPRQNIALTTLFGSQAALAAFNEFDIQNFRRFGDYLEAPPSESPLEDDDDLATRGAAWNFLRYAADRRAGVDQTFWFGLVNSDATGLTNISGNLGTSAVPFLRDWTVAHYTDDAGLGVAAVFTHPSYNFRDVFSNAAFGGYPLAVQTLTNATAVNVSISAGTAGYYRFGVAAGTQADIRVSAGGTTVADPCTVVPLAVGQVYQGTPDVAALCFDGGGAGADFTLIPFNGATGLDTNAPITIIGTNIVATTGGPTPSLSPDILRPLFSRGLAPAGDGGFHLRLRERERMELPGLVRTGGVPLRNAQAAPAPVDFRIQVVRTR